MSYLLPLFFLYAKELSYFLSLRIYSFSPFSLIVLPFFSLPGISLTGQGFYLLFSGQGISLIKVKALVRDQSCLPLSSGCILIWLYPEKRMNET